MKKTVLLSVAFALVLGSAVSALAAGKDVVVYDKPKNGKVTFNHKAHGTKLGDCAKCHQGTPAKIAVNKDAAHGDTCKGCHAKMGGPTKCTDCHKK
ncbi:MAG: cytochrome c3 family protein [Thermodesulfobacteriota bacterium]